MEQKQYDPSALQAPCIIAGFAMGSIFTIIMSLVSCISYYTLKDEGSSVRRVSRRFIGSVRSWNSPVVSPPAPPRRRASGVSGVPSVVAGWDALPYSEYGGRRISGAFGVQSLVAGGHDAMPHPGYRSAGRSEPASSVPVSPWRAPHPWGGHEAPAPACSASSSEFRRLDGHHHPWCRSFDSSGRGVGGGGGASPIIRGLRRPSIARSTPERVEWGHGDPPTPGTPWHESIPRAPLSGMAGARAYVWDHPCEDAVAPPPRDLSPLQYPSATGAPLLPPLLPLDRGVLPTPRGNGEPGLQALPPGTADRERSYGSILASVHGRPRSRVTPLPPRTAPTLVGAEEHDEKPPTQRDRTGSVASEATTARVDSTASGMGAVLRRVTEEGDDMSREGSTHSG